MMYRGIDLSQWNPRTVEIAERHDDLEGRFDYWMRSFDGDIKFMELVYLRHIGEKVFSDAVHSSQDNRQLRGYQEAKVIFELLVELDQDSPYRQGLAKKYIELCDIHPNG